jgi:chemotaxis protein MotB
MARRKHHEEHANHEAWAIPYGDLVTLLLAFFVVMYAVSSVNEGKYRVMADALNAAFGGKPHSISPIQLGQMQMRGSAFDRPSIATPASKAIGPAAAMPVNMRSVRQVMDMPTFGQRYRKPPPPGHGGAGREGDQLQSLGRRVQDALSELVRRKLVIVRRTHSYLEVEIQSDVLFDSGVAVPRPVARAAIRTLAQVLRDEPNAMRVEGYTDDRPIHTLQFNSNWELSAARAASVVHMMIDGGVAPARLEVVGYGDQHPVSDNATERGRNANRRVQLVIMAAPDAVDAGHEAGTLLADGADVLPGPAPVAQPPAPTRNAAPSKRRHVRSEGDVDRSERQIVAQQAGAVTAGAH